MSIAIPSLRAAVAVPPWSKNTLWRRARAVPTLDLRFADNKSLTDSVTGANLVTFTRASSGTYVGSDGLIKTATTDEARFDHNPVTGESLGLLVEESRTNLLLRSEEFGDAGWNKVRSSVTIDAIAAPDGTLTADKLVEDNTVSNTHHLSRNITATTLVHTYSVYAKAGERSRIELRFVGGSDSRAAGFDLSTGTIFAETTPGAQASNPQIQSVGNDWYRCSIDSAGTGDDAVFIYLNNGGSYSYTGDGTSGIYIWGAQLEPGAFPTSYIRTTTAAVTRAADVASITGTAFSGWYRADEGTIYQDNALLSSSTSGVSVDIGAGGAFGTTEYVNWDGTSWGLLPNVAPINVGSSVTTSSTAKLAAGIATNNSALAANSLIGVVDTSCNVPLNPTTLTIGARGWSVAGVGNYLNGTIRRLAYFNRRLPDSTLQTITQ